MRPTDEDQPGSRRPNLMASSRRHASDINILAMLDGLGARPHAGRAMLWYGVGGVLVCGLVGTLVWLAHEPTAQLDSTMVAGGLPPTPIERASAAPPAPAPAQPQPPAGGATIVNVTEEPTPAAPELALAESPAPPDPPLRILPALKPAPAAHAHAPRGPVAQMAPARAVASMHPRLAHASPKRSAPLVKPVPAPSTVDTDVALISAIIQHAAKQRDGADEAGCPDKSCGPRMPPKP